MSVEVGSIVEGTVVKLLPYGVLVKLPNGETGLVHISEIDDSYVRDVNDFFRMNDLVAVKILGINEKGRLELSARQASPRRVEREGEGPTASAVAVETEPHPHPHPAPRPSQEERQSFDEKMSQFMKQSGERLLDLKRNLEAKRGGKKR